MKGYRTYLIAGCAAIVTAVHYMGYIDEKLWTSALAFLGSGAAASLRAALPAK
jgi:hypothetical protein